MRRRRRRRVEALIVLLLVFLVAFGVDRALHAPFFALQRVVVEGGPGFLAGLVGVRYGTPLVDVSTARAAAAVARRDPWVGSVQAVRRFPSTLVLVVRMRRVAAVAETGRGVIGVDEAGRLLPVGPGAAAAYPLLGGVRAPDRPFALLPLRPGLRAELALVALLPAKLRPEVAEVDAGPGGDRLLLTSGTLVRLGPPVLLAAKLRVLEALLAQPAVRRRHPRAIDVADPEAPSLQVNP